MTYGLFSQQEPLNVTRINDQLYQVTGGGAHSFFYISNYEVVVIDAKISKSSAQQLLTKIAEITEKPVRYLLITHHDGDHTRGIPVFQPPVNIYMHKNAFKHLQDLEKDTNLKLNRLNIITFEKNISIHLSKDELRLLYFGPAHTDGDMIIYIPKYKTVIVGDLFLKNVNSYTEPETGGNYYNLETVLLKICQLEVDAVLSGHNGLSTKEDLIKEVNYFSRIRALVIEYINSGKTIEETLEGIPFNLFKENAGYNTEQGFRQNIIDFYNGIKNENKN